MRTLFRELSRLRRKRVFHPFGVGFEGTLTPLGDGGGVAAFANPSQPLVRLSRSFGLPEWLPDPCGLALRIPDAHRGGRHQDLLLATSGAVPGGRHTLLPSRGFCDRPYSSVLPYSLRGELVMFGARGLTPAPGPKLGDLREGRSEAPSFEILLASLRGDWKPVAKLTLGERLAPQRTEHLHFDPTNTGGGLELAGLLNRLRGPTYRASQEGREAAYKRNPVGIG
jgi:hypothetical protein